MRVLVTRPARQAVAWVERLQQCGVEAVPLPLIEIAGPPSAAAVAAAWASLGDRALVVFVSPNAAQAFFDGTLPRTTWPAALRAASPGPGTTAVLQSLGVAPGRIVAPPDDAPQFDSQALWQRLAVDDWQGASVLMVRGDGGRDWLSARLVERGAQVEHLAAYRRVAPTFDAAERARLALALAQPREHVWLFSSSEAIDHLEASANALSTAAPLASADGAGRAALSSAPAADRRDAAFSPWPRSQAVATHPRIAERARRLGIGTVAECRPTLEAVVACIQSMRP